MGRFMVYDGSWSFSVLHEHITLTLGELGLFCCAGRLGFAEERCQTRTPVMFHYILMSGV